MNKSNDIYGLPPDLWPRRIVQTGVVGERALAEAARLSDASDRNPQIPYPGYAIWVSRGLIGRVATVGTTPVLLVREPYTTPTLILNPSQSVGLTTTVTGWSGVAANGQLTPSFGVAGFENVHLHLNVTAIGGADSWDIYAQTYDSISGQWMDSQVVFAAVTAVGRTYSYAGAFGVATDMRFRFAQTAGVANIACSIGATLKLGAGGSSSGLAQVVYLGGAGVTTVSGYPILEGQSQVFVTGENVELWGVANTNINIRLFTL
jgi:hypothetical protein